MVTAGVLVDKMLCDSEKPMEDLGDMRDELKQIASEISTWVICLFSLFPLPFQFFCIDKKSLQEITNLAKHKTTKFS